MESETRQTIKVHANVEITVAALQAVVENAKAVAGKDEKGVYRVDTADKVSEMISKFLLENDFESFVSNINNYYD